MPKVPLVTRNKPRAELRAAEPQDMPVASPVPWSGFFSFSYSITEVSAQGDRTHVKSRHTRLENGKLTSEAFEGELERGVYDGMLRQAQQVVADQTALLLKSLTWFLPRR